MDIMTIIVEACCSFVLISWGIVALGAFISDRNHDRREEELHQKKLQEK